MLGTHQRRPTKNGLMIKSLEFRITYELSLEKDSQKRWGYKTYKPNRYTRETRPWKMFFLFKKGLHIDFQEGANVIVGENGSGKSTLFSIIRGYAGKPPDKLTLVFGNYKNEEEYIVSHKKNYNGPIVVDGDLTYKNTVFFDGEKDNPVTAIPGMLNPEDKSFMSLTAQLFDAQEESHGESMIPVLKYILENAVGATIFMDEPETALSLKNQIWLTKAIKKSVKKNGNQIIISTHALAVIQAFDKVFDMEKREWKKTSDYINEILK